MTDPAFNIPSTSHLSEYIALVRSYTDQLYALYGEEHHLRSVLADVLKDPHFGSDIKPWEWKIQQEELDEPFRLEPNRGKVNLIVTSPSGEARIVWSGSFDSQFRKWGKLKGKSIREGGRYIETKLGLADGVLEANLNFDGSTPERSYKVVMHPYRGGYQITTACIPHLGYHGAISTQPQDHSMANECKELKRKLDTVMPQAKAFLDGQPAAKRQRNE
jgi:hypothetical protein